MSDFDKTFVHMDEITTRLKVCRQTVWLWTKQGKMPSPIRLSINRIFWLREIVEPFLVEREKRQQKKQQADA